MAYLGKPAKREKGTCIIKFLPLFEFLCVLNQCLGQMKVHVVNI